MSKQERKGLCRLLDSRKLTTEASLHAAQNERLPVRAVIQVLFSEQTKLNRHIDWSGSFSSLRSPNGGLDPPGRCLSKRETNAQQMEIRKLKEDVYRLQSQFNAMQGQMERMAAKKKGLFKWRKFGMPTFSRNVGEVEKIEEEEEEEEAEREVGFGRQTPMDMKTSLVKRTPHKWRKSMS